MLLALPGVALAHKPRFPEASPVRVAAPTVSQAFYFVLAAGETYVFEVPPLTRAAPLQVLVLDDEAGRALEPRARWRCPEGSRMLQEVDLPFYESFTRLHHRYRIVDAAGPTSEPCRLELWEVHARPGALVFSIGDEEGFDLEDVFGLLSLGDRLATWRRGEGE